MKQLRSGLQLYSTTIDRWAVGSQLLARSENLLTLGSNKSRYMKVYTSQIITLILYLTFAFKLARIIIEIGV